MCTPARAALAAAVLTAAALGPAPAATAAAAHLATAETSSFAHAAAAIGTVRIADTVHDSTAGFALDGPTGPGPWNTAPASPPATDDGRFGLRLLDVPVSESEDPRARVYIIDNLTPGTVIHRRIEISSTARRPLDVATYPDSAVIRGGSFVSSPGRSISDLTTWTSLSQSAVVVPARGSVIDTVTIAVPKDAAPGERYGVVQAEVDELGPGSVALVNRVGIRIYLSVGGDNPPAANFTVDTLTAHRDAQDHPFVEAMVHNTGGRAIDMSGTLNLVKADGSLTAGPYPVALGTTLAPGQSEPVRTVITDPVPDGPWNAKIELKSGLLDQTFQSRLTFPDSPGVSAASTAHEVNLTGHTGLITGGLLSAAALGAIAYPLVRRRRKRANGGVGGI